MFLMSKYLDLSIDKLHQLLVKGEIKPLDLVTEALDRVDKDNLNCFINVDRSGAIKRAKELENNVRKETEIIQLSGFPMSAEECEMFVISNKSRFRGASAVLNKKVMKAFANLVNTKKIMILPSSIHEMILIPCHDCEYDIESCSEIVKLVNENEVELTEQLTDRAYIIEV